MILNSWEWKQEILSLIKQLEYHSRAEVYMQSDDEEDEEENVFFHLEKALAYSAIAVRLIYEAGKLSDEKGGETIPTLEYKPLKRIGYFEKWVDSDCFDFNNPESRTRSAIFIINQILHSYTILFFSFDKCENVDGFFVSSDQQKEYSLIWISLEKWIRYLKKIVNDDVVSSSMTRDPETGEWVMYKKSCTLKYVPTE